MGKVILFIITVILAAGTAFAELEIPVENTDMKLGITGAGWEEFGQFVYYNNISNTDEHALWISRTFLDLVFNATYRERLKVSLGIEGRMWFNIPKASGTGQATYVHQQNSDLIVSDANVSYTLGDLDAPILTAKAGLFPFKYNKDVRNLGEYLFRSGTYPAYLINNFDLPFARLTGLELESHPVEGLLLQGILSMETRIPPFNDASLTLLAGYNFRNIVDVGLGAQAAHLISVDERQTTSKVDRNIFIKENGDVGYYTIRGTKIMGRLSFDLVQLLRTVLSTDLSMFGKEDCKLYSEAAILGVKSYPCNDSVTLLSPTAGSGKNYWGYDDLKKKIPIMFGVNVPTFKILDVFALEFEYYGSPYPNSYKNRLGPGPDPSVPVPDAPIHLDYNEYDTDNWKWSVYLKKTFFDGRLGLVTQFARDHIRNETLMPESFDYEEALSKGNHWWWMGKIVGSF